MRAFLKDPVGSVLDRARAWTEHAVDISLPLTQGEIAAADRIKTVVLPLGPYRNLTAALFALHPHAMVLNHAAFRIRGSRYDPFARTDPERWRLFKASAVRFLEHGMRGDFGGNILLSHAFDASNIRELYTHRFGETLIKPEASVLLWKDSMRIHNIFLKSGIDLEEFAKMTPEALFLFPIRNPIDCAKSNVRTGHWKHMVKKSELGFESVLESILKSLRHFRQYERKNPVKFVSFTELEIDRSFPERLTSICGLDAPETWLEDAEKLLKIRPKRKPSAETKDHYTSLVEDIFRDDPETKQRLMQFVDDATDVQQGR
jgi:hypothetical protein